MISRNRVLSLAAAAALLTSAGAVTFLLDHGAPSAAKTVRAANAQKQTHLALTDASCSGPAGAAYVTDPGYQGFSAINTANCDVIQTYNDDDLQVPGDPGDYNYDGTAEGIALHGNTLWFAVTGTSNVAAIDTSTLDPSNYNPPETVIPVGLFPEQLAVTPNGSEVWVADSGPQTSTSPVSGVAVIDTSTDKVTGRLRLRGDPTDVAFSPSGEEAYVTTSSGLFVFDTSTLSVVRFVEGLGDPESVAVAPNGKDIYVTESSEGALATIDAATDQVVGTTRVGEMPWQATVSANSATVYVANPDSNTVSVVNTASRTVTGTIDVPGDPDTVALTPDGSQLWVGDNTNGSVTVIDTADGAITGQVNLGGDGPQSGDGLEPTGIVLTTTPTPGS